MPRAKTVEEKAVEAAVESLDDDVSRALGEALAKRVMKHLLWVMEHGTTDQKDRVAKPFMPVLVRRMERTEGDEDAEVFREEWNALWTEMNPDEEG